MARLDGVKDAAAAAAVAAAAGAAGAAVAAGGLAGSAGCVSQSSSSDMSDSPMVSASCCLLLLEAVCGAEALPVGRSAAKS